MSKRIPITESIPESTGQRITPACAARSTAIILAQLHSLRRCNRPLPPTIPLCVWDAPLRLIPGE